MGNEKAKPGERSMSSDSNATMKFTHRANIDRYRRILETFLTAEERNFVERRLAEEQTALQQLDGSVAPGRRSTFTA
jgi:hypothetical protein